MFILTQVTHTNKSVYNCNYTFLNFKSEMICDIFIMHYNYVNKYVVVIIDSIVYVYKNKICKFDPPLFSFQAKNVFIGKSKDCPMTEITGTANIGSDFDGNTLLLECENNEYVYISGLEITKFKIDDKIIDYISLIGNNMIPHAIMIGEKYTYFLYHRYKFIENYKIEEGTLLNTTNTSLDPYDYHLQKCGIDSFKKLERCLIHSFWPGHGENENDNDDVLVEEDIVETQYFNGNNEMVKIFNQKCVICYERDSAYAFRQCGHQCICEQCYQSKGDIDILKCVVCRT